MWGAAMDVGEWLRGLGLGQYEAKFRANGIDEAVLPRLTVDDLREIGVSARWRPSRAARRDRGIGRRRRSPAERAAPRQSLRRPKL